MGVAGGSGSAQSQVWLTYVLSDLDFPKALTLCFSMKRVYTSRKLAVFVSRNVSPSIREVLHNVFDFLFYLEEDRNTAGLKDEEFVRLSAFTLKCFEKVVFLEPTMVAAKNSDDIFDNYEVPNGLLTADVGQDGNDGLSIFVARPCLQVFRNLMDSLKTRNGTGVESYLRIWAKNQLAETTKSLGKKYCEKLSKNTCAFLRNNSDISLVNIDLPLDKASTEDFGLCARLILETRRQIYDEHVQPLLQAMANGPTSPQLETVFQHQLPSTHREPIAIVGMSCRYPSANNLQEFWNLLLNGEDGTGNPPEFRWLREQSPRTAADCRKTNAGFLKVPVDDFDAKFFGISPKEMIFLDPQHRLLHELVWEGLEDAAVNPQLLRGTNGGVFIGSWTNYYKDILEHRGNNEFYRTYMGNSIGAAAARISFLLGMTGPSIATESGCSSAMVAVHLACRALQNRETNFALACGVNLLLHPFDKDEMPMVISPDGHCKTFDANANGFARAEGCGVLVLKRLSDAVRDEDKIWALVRGSAMTQEGVSKSMGTPTVHCESLAMTQALQDGGVDPAQISYVEAHGTGTVVGDPMEVAAIAKAYHSKQRKEPLFIGSVKTNVGHTESCSGITGIMKVVLGMQHEIIPPHRNFETLNPSIDLNAVPAKIPLEPEEWKKQPGISRFAGVSSFGITGTDAHVIIEEPPTLPPNSLCGSQLQFERPLHIMKISAKTEDALDILLESYKNHFNRSTQHEFKNSAYTANIGRSNFSQRAVVLARKNGEAAEILQLNKYQRGEEETDESRGKICFLFTGQGSQYHGMAKELYQTSPVFRMHFDFCQNILKRTYNIDIARVLWSEANSNEVSRTIYSQTSIFCVEYALLKLWESWGVKANYVLGHSLGEFAAAVCANILSVEDALKLVAERSRLIDQLPGGKMLVIKADKQKIDSQMKKFAANDPNKVLDYAAVNSTEQTVVAGDSEVILKFAECCKKAGLKCIVLEATHAFHSKHMDPMLDEYRVVANTVKNLRKSRTNCGYISGMRGTLINANELNAEYWVQHTREKVSFLDASKKAVELGCKIFIEIGPQPVLSALTMMNNDASLLCLPSLKRNENEWETLLNSLGKLYLKGMEIDWKGFDQFYMRHKVSLPHYPFIGKKFWPDISSVTGASIHPLLGSAISNASSSKLFQNGLSLGALDYVKDHAIGEHIIFPGAGYLEMCLAAGLATVEANPDSLSPPTRPMKIENLCIEAPLSLKESVTTQVQTVTEFNNTNANSNSHEDWNDISIKIFRQISSESSKSWQPHAKATFNPLPTPSDKEIPFDANLFLETIKGLPEDSTGITQVYNKLASVGLKFGPMFKSIEKVWKDEKKQTLIAKLKVPEEDTSSNNRIQYIIHPVVLDAMIQAVMMLGPISTLKKSLYVPIKIGKLVWLSEATTPELYVYAFQHDKNSLDGSAVLVDACGNVVAIMSSVELIDTTVKAIESVLEQQSTLYPDLWEEIWKKTPSPLQLAANTELGKEKFFTDEFHKEFEAKYNIPSQELAETYKNLETFIYLNFLRCLYELGWEPELDQCFSESELLQELRIKSDFRQYFDFICDVLEAEGIISKGENGKNWTIVQVPPSLEKVHTMLQSPELSSNLIQRFQSTLLLGKVGESLSEFFRGTLSPLSVLFPEGNKTYPSMTEFYDEYAHLFRVDQLNSIATLMFNHFADAQLNPDFQLRILEIGAGTGAYTEKLVDAVAALEIPFEYTYTDISASFFPAAEKRFEKHSKQFIFKKMNIEEDPLAQGFIPNYFDFVFCGEVLHATKDIGETLRNVHKVLKPYGRLTVQETTRVNRLITYLFGSLSGYWRFQDFELRPKYCVMEKQVWERALHSNGYEVEGIFSFFNDYHSSITSQKMPDSIISPESSKIWILFHLPKNPISHFILSKFDHVLERKAVVVEAGEKFEIDLQNCRSVVRKTAYDDFVSLFRSLTEKKMDVEGIVYCWALDKTQTAQAQLLQPYFNLTKSLLTHNLKNTPRLSLITSEVIPVGDADLSFFHASTLWGYSKTMKNENTHFNCRCIEVTDESLDEIRMEEIFLEIWSVEKQNQVAYIGNSRLVPKYISLKPASNALKLPRGTDRFQLVLPETKNISDLTFGPLEVGDLREDEVEVQIKASALNFRDILSVIKPTEQFKDINTVGFDLAGVVKRVGAKVTKWKAGDRVYGCNINSTAMPSHVILSEDLLLQLPDNMSDCEAATIPAVYITSVVCLIETAKIKMGDIVLLHTATGGVGLSAIEICLHFGCTIIATAGSKRKQNYLRSLGIQHIFHSRNTKYGEQILELTKGRGVDVVLNSLTSEGFKEATLKACAKGARFVEMSKLNIWTKEEVKALRPDVDYTVVDVSSADYSEWNRLMTVVNGFKEEGVVKPIPYVRFDGQNVHEALQYMQKAKHIGKIVCVMPEVRKDGGEIKIHTPMFNKNSTYLITGGLGGIGFVVCRWMVENGAKHVVLAGRSPPTPSIRAVINEMNSRGANVIPVQLDVGNFEQCSQLIYFTLKELELPPLKGIMHAAGTLSDGLVVNQEWGKLSSTFNTKITGTLNLHELTKHLNLEHFVLFSSIAAVFGPPGQCNHSAGNAFEDSFAHYRNAIGLPATSINWGQWGEVGIAKEVDLPGVKTLSNLQGVIGLEYVMKTHRVQTSINCMSSFVLLSKFIPQLALYLDESVMKASSAATNVAIKFEEFWQQYDSSLEIVEKTALLKRALGIIVRNILKLDEGDNIDYDANLQDLGVDSLMFVEIKNGVQALMGDRLIVSASAIKDCDTINLLGDTLVSLIEGEAEDNSEKPTLEQVAELIREDSVLPEHISAKKGQQMKNVREVRTVLLTGCTGTLGRYLLKELTNLLQITEVVCLIRPSKTVSVEERLTKALEGMALLSKVNMRKVTCIAGNVADTHLGIDEEIYARLSKKVDAIFHCAASVLHTQHYKKVKSQKDMRAVNIGGTKNVLEFACENKLKHVYHASTLLAVPTMDVDTGKLSERWPEVGDYDNVTTFGYPVSKFVGDMLAKQAAERGIPVKAFRLPLIVGESGTGRCTIENNHAILRYLFIMKTGIMPSNPLPLSMLPVDICAESSILLFFNEKAPLGMYNISQVNPDTEQEFVNVAKRFGYHVDIADSSEFAKRVQNIGSEGEESAFSIFKDFYEDDGAVMSSFATVPALRSWLEGDNSENMWVSAKVKKYFPEFYEGHRRTMEYIFDDLTFCKKEGWFKKFGLCSD
ncbi:unnamed protein product [Orchesella dallaii]|uniref:Erythronolide synthase, modules 3 and 4 n=1 Tax=Orchesella dallaii TaxID=48710 RepID=A0ABP1Q0N8_9HEXA